MRFRGKSIRRKIVALLLVPLVSLTALWGFATVLTGREASELLDIAYVVEKIGSPVEDAVQVVQQERRQTLVYLADKRNSEALPALVRQRVATDTAVATIRKNSQDPDVADELTPQARERLAALLEAFDGISALRRSVENNTVTRSQALDLYSRLIDPCHTFLANLHVLRDVEMDKQGRALVGTTRARELVSREDALIASALTLRQITSAELRQLTGLIASRTTLYETSLEQLPASERQRYEQLWKGPDTAALRTAEEKLLQQGPTRNPSAVPVTSWEAAAPPVLQLLATRGDEASYDYQTRVEPVAFGVLLKAGAAGVLGFLALIVSVVVSVRVGRDLVRDLKRLRKEAHEASGVRLPSVMRRLAAGEAVDVETEAPRLEYEKDELGQVGQALNTLQRAAVESAVRQADMRRGVSEVFVNLARRNQVLLHRQLTLLDTMERRTEDTDELADLFRLDHLTTRMRRHAEGLVILSGAAPSRQWRKPVQLMDVVRAAVAEVEDYERIEVRRLPRIGVGGPAVADLTHLIAELLENATVFSPPHTAVQVLGERVANGFTLEIHDRGLGMAADLLLDANLRLAETPEFELSDTDRLGLFVVSRLAQRQNVRVSLQQSPYGGTTAVVFIPATLLTDAPDTDGAGFRADHEGDREHGRGRPGESAPTGPGGRPGLTALGRTTPGRAAPSVLDGPVELEPPLGTLGLEPAPALGAATGSSFGDLEDTESERGGIFRARGLEKQRGTGGRSGRGRIADAARVQHQQAADLTRDGADTARPDGPVPLPRRKPALVAEHGRRITPQQPAEPRHTGESRQPAEPRHTGEPRQSRPFLEPMESAGPAGSPEPQPLRPSRGRTAPLNGAAPERPAAAPGDPAPSLGGLPRRVRQASLAPQLKKEAEAARTAENTRPAPVEETERDADEVRSRMASLQRGWQRGRRQNEDEAAETAEITSSNTPDTLGTLGTNTAPPHRTAATAESAADATGPRTGNDTGTAETASGTTAEGDG
ncbi:nitrate- and nitrite sensing domain-containing protein [Streptomyces sp. NPDC004111]|uniref:nitrate- and nitrite sensing domain-containing protein n=1 Tax=Streptomyces sp. NPDC004111 TaxID=3364690 RepID=UPI00369DC151